MPVLYQVKVVAHTPCGLFSGTFGSQMKSRDDAMSALAGLRCKLSTLSYLVLNTNDSGNEVILPKTILEQSVLEFVVASKIVSADDSVETARDEPKREPINLAALDRPAYYDAEGGSMSNGISREYF